MTTSNDDFDPIYVHTVEKTQSSLEEALQYYINTAIRLTDDGCIHPEEAERLDRVLAPHGVRVRRDYDLRVYPVVFLEEVPDDPGDEQEAT